MPVDILLDENFELQFADGDFAFGESTYEHQKTLLLADKGEIKLFPKTESEQENTWNMQRLMNWPEKSARNSSQTA